MPRGFSGGYRRRQQSWVPYRFARGVNEVTQSKHSTKKYLLDGDERANYTFVPGTRDHCFVLPCTELCSQVERSGKTEVVCRGGGISFELVSRRDCSVRVLAFRKPRTKALFEAKGVADGMVSRETGSLWGPVGDSGCVSSGIILGDKPVLAVVDDRSPIFYPVASESRRKVYLDRTFHVRVSSGRVQVRPCDFWVDIRRKLEFFSAKGFGLVKEGVDEIRHDVYFAVIVHVDSFSVEAAVAITQSLGDVRMGEEEEGPVSKRPRTVSDAPTFILGQPGEPVLELRGISARFYWRQD